MRYAIKQKEEGKLMARFETIIKSEIVRLAKKGSAQNFCSFGA